MEQIVSCPHCGNETTHEILKQANASEKMYLHEPVKLTT